jgi:hypothetical protein
MLDSPRPRRYQSAVLLGPRLLARLTSEQVGGSKGGVPQFYHPSLRGWSLGKEVSRQREGTLPATLARLLMQVQGSSQVSPQSALSQESVWAIAPAAGVDAEVCFAGVAQLVEHLFCKQVVRGSSPRASSAGDLGCQASDEHARGFRVLASFGLRSDAHVQKYAPLRSSPKPRQNAELRGRVELQPCRGAAVIGERLLGAAAAATTGHVKQVSESCPSGQREQAVNLPDLSYAGSNPALSTTLSVGFTDPSRSSSKGMNGGGSCFSGLGLVKPAGVAQLVERQPSKLNVEGSSPFSRSQSLRFAAARLAKQNPLATRLTRQSTRVGSLGAGAAEPRTGAERTFVREHRTAGEAKPAAKIPTRRFSRHNETTAAHLAQLVEHVLGKDEVTSSILVVGSKQ